MAQRYSGRRRSYKSFVAEVDEWVKETEKRLDAVMRLSVQDVINEAQLPVAKGGRMRVDTGFLRASGRASINGMPSGTAVRENDGKGAYDDGTAPPNTSVTLALSQFTVGKTFYFGWVANYAKYRELYDGFLEGATRNWSRIVTFNVDYVKQRAKK